MSTTATLDPRDARLAPTAAERVRTDPAYQAFLLLRVLFTAAPILFGLDKFFDVMVDWEQYLAPWINDIVPGSASTAMHLVGVVEIAAGLLVALKPRYGAYVVAAWLAGIIVNLLTLSGYYDVALRDFGLLVSALALGRLASRYDPPGLEVRL
ncbi:MAG TPA: DoxX family membrane protein [Solirubrobacterales bacterium]|nr:DoxX family membrane protein [Solirubrobacterales bacterium]